MPLRQRQRQRQRQDQHARLLSPWVMGVNMNVLYIASGLIAVALAIYLIYVLVRPGDF